MYKLKTNTGEIVKSFDIEVLFEFIISTEKMTFQFFEGYRPISHNDFCKIFLVEIRNVNQYIELESKLHNTKTLVEHNN